MESAVGSGNRACEASIMKAAAKSEPKKYTHSSMAHGDGGPTAPDPFALPNNFVTLKFGILW